MRTKDENKKEAIFSATIKVINEIGFANVSMSKIAKTAGVSASTLYIYYKNKEDLFRKVYVEVKKHMLLACNKGLSEKESTETNVRRMCENILAFAQKHREYFLFLEQSSNSPLITSELFEEVAHLTEKTNIIFQKGINEGTLKDAPPFLLVGFCVYPIAQIYKDSYNNDGLLKNTNYDLVFQMCWDAVKK